MKSIGSLLVLFAFGITPLCAQGKAPKEPEKKLRVLLFTDGPMREYQFVRDLLRRDADKVNLSIFMQSAGAESDQWVDPEFLLKDFPPLNAKPPARGEFDLIIAFDPDWSALPPKRLKELDHWVREQGGGLIIVAGPVHSYRLARPGGIDLATLIALLPVRLNDPRLHGILSIGGMPLALRLKDEGSPILRLDPRETSPKAGWDHFHGKFTANVPVRGFFSCTPIGSTGPGAQVIASLVDADQKEYPFLVTADRGNGKVVFLASAELWRLRACKQEYHQQIWTNLAQHAAGQAGLSRSASWLRAQSQVTQGDTIAVEIRLVDEKGKAIDPSDVPVLRVTPPIAEPFTVALKSRAGADKSNGWFDAGFIAHDVGEYALAVDAADKSTLWARVRVAKLKSRFEVQVKDGELFTRQRDLSQRSLAWSQAMLALAARMSAAKGFDEEAKLYSDAIDATVVQGWSVRHKNIADTYTAMNANKLTGFRTAHDESQALTTHLQAMRGRLLGKDQPKDLKAALDLLRKCAEAEQSREVSLQKAENRLFEAQRRLQTLIKSAPKEFTREEAQEHARSMKDIRKNLRIDAEFVQAENERYRQTLHDLSKQRIRPETMRFLETRTCEAIKQFVEKDFEQGIASLGAVEAMLGKNELDAVIVRKADVQITKLSTGCREFPVINVDALFATLIQLEAEQAQQTRILAELRKQREAELVKELLEVK